MVALDTGVRGAKVQSWHKDNPRDLLKRLIDNNPRWSKDTLFKKLREHILDDDKHGYLNAILEYWFTNNYHSLQQHQPRVEYRAKQERQAKIEILKKQIKTRATQMVLLDLPMPNGKMLRNSTGKDCQLAGGWLTAIARRVASHEVVGNVLSEKEVRALFKAST